MHTLMIVELIWFLVLIVGIILIAKAKKLSNLSKLLWIISLVVFNFIALIVFLLRMKFEK
jgi:hypothetical protein